jgi:eukaryotic-like serine/threonine-protein kinase
VAYTAPLGASACPTCGTTYDYGVMVCPKDGTALAGFKAPITGEHDPVIGLKLGDYMVEKRVAHGGMGIVYRAVHPVIGREVAVKVLRPEFASNQQQIDRFLAEAKAISAIRHRGIVDVISFGQLPDKRQYMIMEFLEGEPLDMLLARDGQLSYNVALPLLDEMLDALSAAHSVGVIHRDMKPSNVFLARQSNGSRLVKLVDFGLAKQTPLGDPNAQAYARASLIAGTPEYISPEQIRGEAPTARTDLYGFAVVAFEVLTHKLPFVGQTVVDTLEMHARRPPPHVKVFRGDVPAALDDLIFRLMSKRPEDRPSSAEAARQELQRLMREMNIDLSLQPREAPTSPSLPEIPSLATPLPQAPKSRAPLFAAAGALALAVIGAVAFGAFQLGKQPAASAVAPSPAVPAPVLAPPLAKVDPPPEGPVAEVVAPEVEAPKPVVDDPPSPPPPGKGKKERRPFANLDGASDNEWRATLTRRLEKKWKRFEARSRANNSPLDPFQLHYNKLLADLIDTSGPKARLQMNQRVADFETKVLK